MQLVLKDVKRRYRQHRLPVYVLFFTDGEAEDKEETLNILKEVRDLPVFWMFVEVRKGGFSLIPSFAPNCLGELAGLDNVDLIRLSRLGAQANLGDAMTKKYRRFLD
jgi:hypothetical protein